MLTSDDYVGQPGERAAPFARTGTVLRRVWQLCCLGDLPGRGCPGAATDDERVGTIATRYGSSSGQKQQYFGRVDPFCMFAVLPMLIIAGLFLWSGIASLGMVLIFLVLLIVAADSWANRPIKKNADRYDEDY